MPGSDSTTGFQQAQLLIEGQDALTCWFNPTDYTVSKANRWSDGRQLSEEFPQREFIGGDPREQGRFARHTDGRLDQPT